MYNAAGDPTIYECGPYMSDPDTDLADWFSRAKSQAGASVVRFWAFQAYTAGGTNWQSLDRVVRIANQYSLKVIPVLENQWSACTQGGYKWDTWFGSAYTSPYGTYPISYQEYVRRVVTRYANEPAIAAWMLMNEAESQSTSGTADASALYSFASTMSGYVKSLDSHHLVTLGTLGGPQPGISGSNYEDILGISSIDFAEFHDYGADDQAMPGAVSPPVADLYTEFFSQDFNWTWNSGNFVQNHAQTWDTYSGVLPNGTVPFQHIGLNIYGGFVGDMYIDDVQVGSRAYDFEDGTTDGWGVTSGVTITNSTAHAFSGTHALKVTRMTNTQGFQVYFNGQTSETPGTPVTFHVYVDTTGTPYLQSTLAAAVAKSAGLNKPLLIGESGMWVCTASSGEQLETTTSRASKMDAKLGAFFQNGGAGYLVWAWDPTGDCTTDFTTGDPLNTVLSTHAAQEQGI
jgi:hypothetical protein